MTTDTVTDTFRHVRLETNGEASTAGEWDLGDEMTVDQITALTADDFDGSEPIDVRVVRESRMDGRTRPCDPYVVVTLAADEDEDA